jgi:hypothetical protein
MNLVLICLAIGAAMGLLSGLLGVGGGIIAVPAMMYFLKFGPKLAMGTSLAIIIPVSIAGAAKHFHQGQVDLRVALYIALAGMVCAYLGAWLNSVLDPHWLRRLFAIFIIAVGVRMLFESPRASVSADARSIPPPAQQPSGANSP